MKVTILKIIFFLLSNSIFAQDSTEIVKYLSEKSFEQKKHDFKCDSTIIRTIIFTGKTIKVDSVKLDDYIDLIVETSNLSFLSAIKENEIHVAREGNRTNYYRCFSLDSVRYYRYAQITFSLKNENVDSIFQVVKKELQNGKTWTDLKYFPTDCNDIKTPEFKGLSSWTKTGELDKKFEKQVIKLKKGEVALIKLKAYNSALIVYKTDDAILLPERRIKMVSVLNH
jgi:hypothetical protein